MYPFAEISIGLLSIYHEDIRIFLKLVNIIILLGYFTFLYVFFKFKVVILKGGIYAKSFLYFFGIYMFYWNLARIKILL